MIIEKIINKIKTTANTLRVNVAGWHTNKKIVVIESDDWGSIRTSSRSAYETLIAEGYNMQKSMWSKDSLECDEDLQMLFEVLMSVRDSRERPACITANMILANPDFKKIEENGYNNYFFETVSDTLNKKGTSYENVTKLWIKGLEQNIFIPQLHAREHICWWEWLNALQNENAEALDAFSLKMCGVPWAASKEKQSFYSPLYLNNEELPLHNVDLRKMVLDGVMLFTNQFGYTSLSTVAPNTCWTDEVEKIWNDSNIKYIQGITTQFVGNMISKRLHFLGESNRYGQYYLIRNCYFEPSAGGNNPVQACLKQVDQAFKWHKPAIISSHRANYIGAISLKNRMHGLNCLRDLLTQISDRWSDVFFLSSPELGHMIAQKINDPRELKDINITGHRLK